LVAGWPLSLLPEHRRDAWSSSTQVCPTAIATKAAVSSPKGTWMGKLWGELQGEPGSVALSLPTALTLSCLIDTPSSQQTRFASLVMAHTLHRAVLLPPGSCVGAHIRPPPWINQRAYGEFDPCGSTVSPGHRQQNTSQQVGTLKV
jgi:hypothetical protein